MTASFVMVLGMVLSRWPIIHRHIRIFWSNGYAFSIEF
jgi:hypothetical protein